MRRLLLERISPPISDRWAGVRGRRQESAGPRVALTGAYVEPQYTAWRDAWKSRPAPGRTAGCRDALLSWTGGTQCRYRIGLRETPKLLCGKQ
ncbi:MAG: hypothetical protein ACC645_09595, partial [Pirellulales bacterium]